MSASTPRELARLFHVLGPAYMRWSSRSIPSHGISPARIQILELLKAQGPSPMRTLKDASGSSATNITKLALGLEAEGLVARLASADDKRVTLLQITPKGRHALKGAWEAYEESVSKVFEALSEADRQHLRLGVKALLAALGRES